MFYTVSDVCKLSGTTRKALRLYHELGLLLPAKVGENGYRYYDEHSLERLQLILLWRAVDMPLSEISRALQSTDRSGILQRQRELLLARRRRTDCLLALVDKSILAAGNEEHMSEPELFKGLSEEEWNRALEEQRAYLRLTIGYDLPPVDDAERQNRAAREAAAYTGSLLSSFKAGIPAGDSTVRETVCAHARYLGQTTSALAEIARWMATDDFHRRMLENQAKGFAKYQADCAEAAIRG